MYPYETFSTFRDECFRPFPDLKGKNKDSKNIYINDVKITAGGQAKMNGSKINLANGKHLVLIPESLDCLMTPALGPAFLTGADPVEIALEVLEFIYG